MSPPVAPLARLTTTGSAYAAAVILQVLVQAANLPLLTRLLAPGQYGLTATALVVANLLAVMLDLGLSRAITRAYYREATGPGEAAGLVVGGLAIVIALSVLAVVLLPVWGGWLGDDARPTLQVAVALGGAMAGRNVVLGLLRAAGHTRSYVGVMLLGTAGAQLAGLAVTTSVSTPVGYLAGLAGGSVAGTLLGLAVLRPRGMTPRARGAWPWALRFSLALLPAELAAVAIWFSDRIIIEQLLGLEEVGRYQIAYTLGSLLLMLAMGVSQAWAPIVYGAAAAERGRVAEETRVLLLRIASYGVVAVALAAPVALVLVIPGEYRPDGLFAVAALVALSVLPLITQQAATHLLADADRTALLGAWGVAAAVVNVGANLALVPLWGLNGSALATLVTYAFYAATVSRAARRATAAHVDSQWRPWLVAVAGAVVGSTLPAGGLWSVLRSAAALAALGLCLRELLPVLRPVEVAT